MSNSISKIEIIDGKIHWEAEEIKAADLWFYTDFSAEGRNWLVKNQINPDNYIYIYVLIDDSLVPSKLDYFTCKWDYRPIDISLYYMTSKQNKNLVKFHVNTFNDEDAAWKLQNTCNTFPTGAYLIKNAIIFDIYYSEILYDEYDDPHNKWIVLLVPKYDGGVANE